MSAVASSGSIQRSSSISGLRCEWLVGADHVGLGDHRRIGLVGGGGRKAAEIGRRFGSGDEADLFLEFARQGGQHWFARLDLATRLHEHAMSRACGRAAACRRSGRSRQRAIWISRGMRCLWRDSARRSRGEHQAGSETIAAPDAWRQQIEPSTGLAHDRFDYGEAQARPRRHGVAACKRLRQLRRERRPERWGRHWSPRWRRARWRPAPGDRRRRAGGRCRSGCGARCRTHRYRYWRAARPPRPIARYLPGPRARRRRRRAEPRKQVDRLRRACEAGFGA